MKRELLFKNTRIAKGKGGDRYEAEMEGEDRPLVFYFPQSISRVRGVTSYIIPTLKVTVEISDVVPFIRYHGKCWHIDSE